MISKKGLGRQVVPGEIEIQCNVCSICSRCLFSANLSFEHVSFNSRYLFGADLSGFLEKDDFVKLQVQSWSPNEFFIVEMKIAFLGYLNCHCCTLQGDLISDVLEMEFTRYAEDTSKLISETDFCRHLLYSASISQKKKEKMIKIVTEKFEGREGGGISFDSFKTFYYVLFGWTGPI